MKRLPSTAGIAIGPILFVLAMLGIIASLFASSGGSSLGSAGIADRITADIVGQANLIRSKISECQMQYLINSTNFATGPDCVGDSYPCSDLSDGTNVADLTCPNDPKDGGGNERSLWMGLRPASYPPPTQGFADWKYINAGAVGGRCIWTAPTGVSGAIVDGLTRAAAKFTSQELTYNSTTGKFVVFITRPSGAVDSNCTAP